MVLYHSAVRGTCSLCDRESDSLLLAMVHAEPSGAEYELRICGTDLAGALAVRAMAYDQGLPKP
jgi:hypothetical protein